jgi:SAM-dependent methyltransferase
MEKRNSDQNLKKKCPLCYEEAIFSQKVKITKYYKCPNCKALFMDSENYLSAHEEKKRYLEHNNDVDDPGYQKFVIPIVNCIKNNFEVNSAGLDFGCGTGPVISKLLNDSGYSTTLYDPFFHKNPNALKSKYDYIICCEVIEHFNKPEEEFRLLKSLLNNKGKLICMTEFYSDNLDFKKWYYKDDPSHVFFYREETLEWIKDNFNFSSLTIDRRLIEFTV